MRGEKKCSDCRRIVADRQQSFAAQQYAAARPNPEGATGTRRELHGPCDEARYENSKNSSRRILTESRRGFRNPIFRRLKTPQYNTHVSTVARTLFSACCLCFHLIYKPKSVTSFTIHGKISNEHAVSFHSHLF